MKACHAAAPTQGVTVTSGGGKTGTNNTSSKYTGDVTDQSEVPAGIFFFLCTEKDRHHIVSSFTGWQTLNSF